MPHILIVDDEDVSRYTLRQMLESLGHSVAEASNGVTGLQAAKDGCDLIITDIIMPDMEGIAFIKELKQTYPGRPVIAISGGGRTRNLDFLEIARQFGADDSLAKPFTTSDLGKALAAIGLTGKGDA